MKNVLILGAGGIGSYLAEHIGKAVGFNQLDYVVTIADDDEVEFKNLPYQNFTTDDIGKKKVDAVVEKNPELIALPERVSSPRELQRYDLVVSCVDNAETRRLIYEHARDWVDLRSFSRVVAMFHKCEENGSEEMGKHLKESKLTSCQNPKELGKNIVQYGNVVAAAIGIQTLVNRERGDRVNPNIIMEV